MPRRKVLVRTDNEEFARDMGAFLRRKGANVTTTSSLNDVGHALIEPDRRQPDSYLDVLEQSIRIARRKRHDFVIFDPWTKQQEVEPRFQDLDARRLKDRYCQVDGTHFLEESSLGWERNYLGYTHFVRGSELAELPDEFVRGLAFLQELKNVGKIRIGFHPNFPFVLASDDERMGKYARLMHSYGFVDYSDGIKSENVGLLETLSPEDRETLEIVADYFSSGARAAIATSALALVQPALEAIRIITPVAHAQTQSTQTQNVPKEVKIVSNHGPKESDRYTCVGYWIGNPRMRLCVSELDRSLDNFSFGLFLPLSKNELKIAASKNGEREEAGVYVHQNLGEDILLGVSGEYLDGEFSGEAHGRLAIPYLDSVYIGYVNNGGRQTFTVGDFLDLGQYHFALIFSEKRERDIYTPQLRAYASRDGIVKLFYTEFHTDGGKTRSLGGFIRVGKEFRPYTPKGFDGDRLDFAQGPNIQSSAWPFHIPLFPQNTHLSDQGIVAIEPRVLLTPDESRIGIRGFYTHDGRWIGGYGIARSERDGEARYEHTLSVGANIGPVKVAGSYELGRGLGVYAMFRQKPR